MASSVISLSVDQAGGTTAELIAGKTNYKIQVLSMCLAVSGAACTVKSTLQDTAANTVRMTIVGNATAPAIWALNGGKDTPLFETVLNDGLELATGTAAVVQGILTYTFLRV